LIEHAARHFETAHRRADLESAARQGHAGSAAKLAAATMAPPAAVAHLWHWWLDLHQGRRTGGFGPEPLGWSDIDAWARLCCTAPRVDEVRAIMRIDAAWLSALAERRKSEAPHGR
jgi:hypothetical protein